MVALVDVAGFNGRPLALSFGVGRKGSQLYEVIMLFLLFTLSMGFKTIDLNKLELYADAGLTACRQDGDLFLAGRGDNRIVRLNSSGNIVAVYAQHGKGPFELDAPSIVGCNSKEIFVLNRGRDLMFLSLDLKVVKDKVLHSSDMLTQGVLLRDGILAFSVRNFSAGHCVKLFQIKDGELDPIAVYGETSGDFRNKETFQKSSLDKDEYFMIKPYLDFDTYYEIPVFKYNRDGDEMVHALRSDISDLRGNNKHLLIGHMVHVKNGYLVSMEQTDLHYQVEQTYLDHFNEKGGFVRRERAKSRLFLVPVINSDDDLIVERDLLKATFVD